MELLASGFEALEGATIDATGALLFSDLRGGGVHRLDHSGVVQLVVPGRKAVGGICLHADGGLVLSGADLCHVSGARRRVLLELGDVAAQPGSVAVAFNDIAADRRGRLFAGVLRQDAAGRPVPGELLWITAEREHIVVDDDVHPNGIAFSPDRSRLYLADTLGERLIVFTCRDDEVPARVMEISTATVDGLPDGMAVDAEGFIWVAFYRGSCVVRFDPNGRIARRVAVRALKPLSVCLAGGEQPALFVVTATRAPGSAESGSVYRMALDVGPDRPERASI